MNILVTGSHGFIGSHLVERLLKDGHQVLGIDNFNTGNKSNLQQHPNLECLNASIFDDVGEFFEGKDIVFHLAALTRPQWSIEHPLEADHVNVQGTLKILKHCQEIEEENKVERPRVVFASSSSLYGIPEVFPTPETEPSRPLSPYGLQKYLGELYCKLFERMYGLEINCVRPFNVYGTRQNLTGGYTAAVPKFIDNLRKDRPGYITGDGTQSRDFTHVDDVVDLMVKASMSKVFGESFNAGAGHNVSINAIYDKICRIMNKNIKPLHIDPVVEPQMTLADTSKAWKLLGWKPRVDIDEGLRRTVEGTLNG